MSHAGALLPAWQKGQSGNPGGRTPSKWLREYLGAATDKTDGAPIRRQRIAEFLFEVATSWQIQQRGRDYEVASARDAVEAAKLLLAYDMGQPVKGQTVQAPRDAAGDRSTLDLILATYRERLLAGELSEGDLSTLAALLMAAEKTEAEIVAKLLGDRKGTTGALKERAEEVMRKLEARTATVGETPAPEAAPAEVPPSEEPPVT
jgi:hypothetical protein